MSVREKWRTNCAGPWPLFVQASETCAAQDSEGERVWTAREGAPVALPSICPHRGMPLAGCEVEGGQAICPYHGMRLGPIAGSPMFRFRGFDWAGERNAAVEYLEAQIRGQPWMREVFRLEGSAAAPPILCLENFLDASHTPHVHPGMIRKAGQEQWQKAMGTAREWGFEIQYEESGVQSGWLGKLAEPPRSASYGRYLHPFGAQVDYVGLDGKSYFRATAFMRPTRTGTQVLVVVESSLQRMGQGFLTPIRFLTRGLFAKVLGQDTDALNRSWRGIEEKGWGPADLAVRTEDLAWPWMRRWMEGNPPAPGETFEGKVFA
jgi:phenylpropionate dioxygenase-like ring-hydroxylating dioxygenase large terminal subunit